MTIIKDENQKGWYLRMDINANDNPNQKLDSYFNIVTTIAIVVLVTAGGCFGLLGIFMNTGENKYPGATFYGGDFHLLISIIFLLFPVILLGVIISSFVLRKMQKTQAALNLYIIPLIHLLICIGIAI